MLWYYARDGQQDGPHSDESIQELARTGMIDSATLVWSEGMAEWQPISQAAPHLVPAAPVRLAPKSGASEVHCAECGAPVPASEVVSLQGLPICARCKPVRLQKMRESVHAKSPSYELERLLRVAKAQRGVNMCILILIVCYAVGIASGALDAANRRANPPGGLVAGIVGLVILGVYILQVIYVYRLASALESGVPILWVLGILCLSCIGLLLLLYLSHKATQELRAAGFKVGLLGGNPKDVERKMAGG